LPISSMSTLITNALPVWRWLFRQWQQWTKSGSDVSRYRIAPHEHPPSRAVLRGRATAGLYSRSAREEPRGRRLEGGRCGDSGAEVEALRRRRGDLGHDRPDAHAGAVAHRRDGDDRPAHVVHARVVWRVGAERHFPWIDGHVHLAARVVGTPQRQAAVEGNVAQSVAALDDLARKDGGAGETRDER